jgi:hypothetical protein
MNTKKEKNETKPYDNLISTLTATPHRAPLQKITPVKETVDETKFTLHLPTDIYNKLKRLAADKGKGVFMKNLIAEAVTEHFFPETK